MTDLSLALRELESHINYMSKTAKKSDNLKRSMKANRTVVYRGIKIQLMSGKRSPLAQAIRDGLRAKYEKLRAEPDQK
jgi:hypothetical protein